MSIQRIAKKGLGRLKEGVLGGLRKTERGTDRSEIRGPDEIAKQLHPAFQSLSPVEKQEAHESYGQKS